jgi:hypothetical protein
MQSSNKLYPNGNGLTQLGVHRPPSIMSEATLSQWLSCMSRDNVGMLTKVNIQYSASVCYNSQCAVMLK